MPLTAGAYETSPRSIAIPIASRTNATASTIAPIQTGGANNINSAPRISKAAVIERRRGRFLITVGSSLPGAFLVSFGPHSRFSAFFLSLTLPPGKNVTHSGYCATFALSCSTRVR